jgi:sugar phosphate isomerase/epimerase
MSIRLGSRFTARQPLAKYLSLAAHYFRAIELPADPQHLSPYFTYTAHQKSTLAIYQRHHQFQLTMHAPFVNCRLGALDPEERRLSRIKILASMQLAADLEIKWLTCHPCSLEPNAPERYAENWGYEAESLAYLLIAAQRLGVNLLLENMPSGPLFHHSTCDGSRLQELLWLFPEPQFGLTIDLGHALQAKVKIDSLLKLERIRHFHLHENDRQTDAHLAITANLVWWHKMLNRLTKKFPDAVAILEMDQLSDQLTSLLCLQTPPVKSRLNPFSNVNWTPSNPAKL